MKSRSLSRTFKLSWQILIRLNAGKEIVDKEVEADELDARTESFRRDMLNDLTLENYFDDCESGDEGEGENNNDAKRVIPPKVTIDFGPFSVSCDFNGDNEGSGSLSYTVRGGDAFVVSEEDSYFTEENLDKVFEPIKEHLPGVDVELFRKHWFCVC
eukprot:scaffold4964_cov248-Ochromonas_danica.AAC.8